MESYLSSKSKRGESYPLLNSLEKQYHDRKATNTGYIFIKSYGRLVTIKEAYFYEVLTYFQGIVLRNACSMFLFEPLHNSYLSTSNLLK